ncbi:MAG TPA: ice-binding family protein [Nitrosopumilaceae archaeon]|nr:ice-binding family protein [Nitrosopumilaceae archaeon]
MVQNHAFATSAPNLGTASTFGILANTYTNTSPGTSITGDLGYTTAPAMVPTISGSTHVADSVYSQAGTDQGTALAALNALACNFTFGSAIDLSLLTQPLTPGVYCVIGAQSVGTGGIILSGAGTYVFRSTGALNTVASSHVTLSGGADASNVFWTPVATTLGANSVFVGTDIDNSGITIGSNVSITGRALAIEGIVSTAADTITVPIVTLSSIAITTPATKLIYTVGNTLNTTGLVVTGTFSDASTSVVTPDSVTGFDSSAPVTGQVLTIHVGSQSTTYTINVVAAPIVPLQFHMSESPTPSGYHPSLGGVQGQTFNDGLKINGHVFDVSKFHTSVPQQVLPLGKPATISIKQGLTRGSPFWQHVMIFMNFGAKDTKTGNADTWISIDKNDGVQVHDPNGFVTNVSANNTFIAYGMTTTFTFTPVKQMSDSNMIIRVWDNQLRQTDANVDGAIVLGDVPKPPIPMQKPDWIQVFSNLKDADNAVESAGFKKPVLFAHISTTSQVWTQPNTGHVLWFFDTKDAYVALIIYDINGNMVREDVEQLVKASDTWMGKDTSYTGNHLNRQNVDEINQAKAQQELNAIQTMERLGYRYAVLAGV